MTEVSRKGSLGFFNPFKSKLGSKAKSRASSLVDFKIGEDARKGSLATVTLKKTSSSGSSSRAGSAKNSIDHTRSTRQGSTLASSRADGDWDWDAQTGERKDHTELLHSLAARGSEEELVDRTEAMFIGIPPKPAQEVFDKLTKGIWHQVVGNLGAAEKASLALSCKPFREFLGTQVWNDLNGPENRDAKAEFLAHLDEGLPDHLLCFPCNIYHVRSQKGQEMLRPTNVSNPVFECPNVFNAENKVSRHRITVGRALPYPFVQLILRAQKYSKDHGILIDSMSRRYKEREGEWTHQTRYVVVDGHLLVRVISSTFATPALPPAGLRRLLYSPSDNFHPFFSVCAHWRDGNLMPAVKCALSHLPKPPEGSGIAGTTAKVNYHFHRPHPIITLCSECRPMRRCPDCPTEYLIEMKVQEDRSDPDPRKLFKHALVVTRWSDLGDGSSPKSLEWAACNGDIEYDSNETLGRRAIAGTFESQFTVDQIPGQKMISMNPDKVKLGEKGHDWY